MNKGNSHAAAAIAAGRDRGQGPVSRALIWFSGYSRRAASGASLPDRELLQKVGGAVLFAALWAAIEWAWASGSFFPNASFAARIAAAGLIGLLGAGFVVTFDRTAVHLMDTRVGPGTMRGWLVFRILVILFFSTLTTERILHVWFAQDAQQQALQMREQQEAKRHADLQGRFRVPVLERRTDAQRDDLARLERESETVPAAIQAGLDRAVACRRTVAAQRRYLRGRGYTPREAARAVAGRAAECRRTERDARAELNRWREEMRQRVEEARSRVGQTQSNLALATSEIDRQVQEARDIERRAIAPGSIGVLLRTIFSNPANAAMALAIYFLSLAVQLAPFILKGYAGQTGVGVRMGSEREISRVEARKRLRCKLDEAGISIAASRATAESMVTALGSEEVAAHIQITAAEQVMMLAPLYAAIRTAREAVEAKEEFDAIAVRAPDLASFVYRLWADAIRQIGPEGFPGPDFADPMGCRDEGKGSGKVNGTEEPFGDHGSAQPAFAF